MSEKVCPLAWQHISTTTSGSIRLCCNSENTLNKAIDSNGRVLKIYRDDINESLNTKIYKDTRLSMLGGRLPDACRSCALLEDKGLDSPRNFYNDHFHFDSSKAHALTHNDGSLKEGAQIKYLDLRLGNLCNLQCRMCNPWSSSALNQEMNQLFNYEDVGLLDWPDRNELWINKILSFDKLEEVYLTGGEPTIIKNNIKLLELLFDRFGAGLRIKVNTNLFKLDDVFFKTLRKFKDVHVKVSVDCFEEINDYIRYPSTFKTIASNLDRLLNDKFEVEIQTTVQIYNFFHLPSWFNYCRVKRWPSPKIFHLSFPEYLDIRILPKRAWDDFLIFNKKELLRLETSEKSSIFDLKVLVGSSYSEDKITQFNHYTNKLDDHRYGMNKWSKINPINLE